MDTTLYATCVSKRQLSSNGDDSHTKKPKNAEQSSGNLVLGLMFFCNTKREKVREKLLETNQNPNNSDIMRELAKMWKELSHQEMNEWNTLARQNMEQRDQTVNTYSGAMENGLCVLRFFFKFFFYIIFWNFIIKKSYIIFWNFIIKK